MQLPAIAPGDRRTLHARHRYKEGAIRSWPEAFAFGIVRCHVRQHSRWYRTVIQFVRCEAGVLEEIASGALRLDT